jgi:tetratricopeptide (TPR) repeat protein
MTANYALCQEVEGCATSFCEVDELLDQGVNQQAWQLLQELPEEGPNTAGRLWRMARAQYEMGRLADKDSPKFFKSAEEYARSAIKEYPDNSEGYKWLAIALGAQSKYSDTKAQVHQSREVKESIEKALFLNPDDDIAYLVLSRWHYKVSALGWVARTFARVIYGGIPKASLDEAEKLLWKAISLRDRIAHRYNLAKVYKRMDRLEDAMTQLRLAILLPVTFPEESEELVKSRKKLVEWQ